MRATSVLLVDDNRPLLRILTRFLQEAGEGEFRVVAAEADEHEAVRRAIATQPDAVLLDLQLHSLDTSGLALLPQLRESLPRTALVILTMMDQDGVRDAALAAGADGFVAKANIERDLLPTLRAVVATKQLECAAWR